MYRTILLGLFSLLPGILAEPVNATSHVFDRSPGFGEKLIAINPSIDYQDISPNISKFRVSGFDFFSDGRLAISLWDAKGRVYILENPQAPQEEHKYIKYAEGLHEALGIKVVDDQVYVLQKSELTRLDDTDKDGVADEYVCISNKWDVTTNFHEFSFGPLYKDGKFYIALAVAVNPGGVTTNPQTKDRGTIIEIDPKSGDYRVVLAGLRTPNGLMINAAGDMFVADNQGDYLPANKIMHIKEGAFYNHTYSPKHAFADKEVTQPAAWLQQNEIANSPTQGSFVPHGIYKDQLLIGDIHHGGLKRIFFEKIDGEYQSAAFRFTQNLRASINRTVVDKDNNLYLGGCGMGGNWATEGLKHDGIMRVKLYDKSKFEMLAIRAKSNGIEIEFTEPVVENIAWTKSLYRINQWTYKPTRNYGGPKIDKQQLEVLSVTPSEDLKKVFVEIAGMKEKHVINLRLANNFASKSGAQLFTGDAYYTLNKIPQNKVMIAKSVPSHVKLISNVFTSSNEHPGAEVYRALCMSCHSLDGSKLVGPTFKGLAKSMRTVIKNGKEEKVHADRAYLRRSITKPAEEVAKGYQPIMPTLAPNMSKKQLTDVIDYMESLAK